MKLTEKSRKILRAIYRGVGTAAVSLSLTMCPNPYIAMYGMPNMYGPGPDMYGMPPDITNEEVVFSGKVISKETQEGIHRIAIWVEDLANIFHPKFTNWFGDFYFFVSEKQDNYTLIFTDVDGNANGGRFKQHKLTLTLEQALTLKDNPITIELELED